MLNHNEPTTFSAIEMELLEYIMGITDKGLICSWEIEEYNNLLNQIENKREREEFESKLKRLGVMLAQETIS